MSDPSPVLGPPSSDVTTPSSVLRSLPSDVLIKVEGVRKKFCRSLKRSLFYGLRDMAAELAGGSRDHETLRKDEFWAVNDVSFELRRGECLGLIGRNGAGKTTLLKMLNGLIKPDAGRITMHGRVGALIALGAGFNPILTGRENIYVNASVLGLTKAEVDAKIEEIIDFADVRDFIDAPVQSYSSGMTVRLGFAVATALDPDVLILDEVLAVGDVAFRNRCYTRIREMLSKAAVVYVSHQMNQIGRLASTVMLLQRGRIHYFGSAGSGIRAYFEANDNQSPKGQEHLADLVVHARVGLDRSTLEYDQGFRVMLTLKTRKPLADVAGRLAFFNSEGEEIAEYNSLFHGQYISLPEGESVVEWLVQDIRLRAGSYKVSVFLMDRTGVAFHYWGHQVVDLQVEGRFAGHRECQWAGSFRCYGAAPPVSPLPVELASVS